MKASIVMATYNRNDLLAQTLQGMADMDTAGLDWEVVLTDNAGNDETARVAESFADSLPLKFLVETAPGKNNALTTALKHTTGDLYIFTDDDIVPDPAWIKSLLEAAGRWPDADLFGGRILPKYPEGTSAPVIDDPVFMRIAFVIADWDLEEGEFPAGKIWGPNMMVRRRVFDQGMSFNTSIGPTGKSYVMGSETEFLLRASDAGYTAVYVPTALVYHQIRSEQLDHAWIRGRAFRVGRGLAYHDENTPVLKVKKWMLRELATLYTRYLYTSVTATETETLQHAIRFHKMRGHIYQCYKGRRQGS